MSDSNLDSNTEHEQLNKEFEKRRTDLKNRFKETYDRFEKYYFNLDRVSNKGKSYDEIYELFSIINKYDDLQYHVSYNYSNNSFIYNIEKIYNDYKKILGKTNEDFIKDIIYLYRWGWIYIDIPDGTRNFFLKPDLHMGIYGDPFICLERACTIYDDITQNSKITVDGIICFTGDGDKIKSNGLQNYLIDKVLIKQKELEEQQQQLKSEQLKFDNRIQDYTKEIISIISIILAIAPLIAINVAEIPKMDLSGILLVNGSLIIGITTIFSIVAIMFFQVNKKTVLLWIPLAIGIILICLGLLNANIWGKPTTINNPKPIMDDVNKGKQ